MNTEKKTYEQPNVKMINLNLNCMIGDQGSDPIDDPQSLDLKYEEGEESVEG